MERKIYTTPRTKLFSVELEGTFAGSIVQGDNTGVNTSGHEIGATIDMGEDTWNNGEWTEATEE